MRSIKEIQEIKTWLKDEYHNERVKQQMEDDQYIRDDFELPHIKTPYAPIKLGTAFRLVNMPANHIITSNPQVYVQAVSNGEVAKERAYKRGALLNYWADYVKCQNPQPYKESVKNKLWRGESWVHVVNNPNFAKEGFFSRNIPVTFITPDPLTVFGSPSERDGVPEFVIRFYPKDFRVIINKYAWWDNPKHRGEPGNISSVEWWEFWDANIRYFEADGKAVTGYRENGKQWTEGQEPNILGFVPFVHAYSGYGKSGAQGKPEDLVVSRIRYNRGLILEKAEVRSGIASQLKLHAVPRVDVIETEAHPVNADGSSGIEYSLDPGSENQVPIGWKVDEHVGAAPAAQVFQHARDIDYELEQDNPPVMSGITTGSSGRQDDIATKHGIAQFESIVDNTNTEWSTAFKMGLHILKKVPGLLPLSVRTLKYDSEMRIKDLVEVKEEDIDDFECEIMLKAKDPIEDKALALQGNREQAEGVIDAMTNLTKYHGYTTEEAREILDNIIIDKLVAGNEALQMAIAGEALKRLGMEKYMPPAPGQVPPQPSGPVPGQPGARGGPPREGNVQNTSSYQEADNLLQGYKVRNPPNVLP